MSNLQALHHEPTQPGNVAGDTLEPASPAGVLAIRLFDLAQANDSSVRLLNSLSAAEVAGRLPFETVADYLAAGDNAQAIMLRDIRNFGRKTARELDALVASACAGLALLAPPSDFSPVKAERRAAFLALFAGDTLSSLTKEELVSARLINILAESPFAEMPFAEALSALPKALAALLNSPNCGRKSANEFRQLVRRHILRRLAEAGHDTWDPIVELDLADELQCGPDSDGEHAEGLLVPDHGTLAERIEWMLGELETRAACVVRRRNGIGQSQCETLEEVGADYKVTRERIRQIEAKALRRLRVRMHRAPVDDLLETEQSGQWQVLTDGTPFLRRAELPQRRHALDGYVRLVLELRVQTLEAWLDQIAQPMPLGWLEPRMDKATIEAAAKKLEVAVKGGTLPQTIICLVGEREVPSGLFAADLILGRPVRLGYLMPYRVGPRLNRLIRLHSLLASRGSALPVEHLVAHYRFAFNDDPCTERDAEIVMDAAPHLFLEIEEGCWEAVGPGGAKWTATKLGSLPTLNSPRVEDSGTIAHALQTLLEDRGPTRLADFLEDAAQILPDGRSINSIGPVLLTRRELFVRALPGVYALPHQISSYIENLPKDWSLLLNDVQARLYAVARYAGEPRRIFPFWTAAAEKALCRWARHSGSPGVFASLMSVARIDDWSCGAEERMQWQHVQKMEGHYQLGVSLRREAAYDCPQLDRLLAACRYAKSQGTFNWVAANRLTGRKIDSHGGAALVALMVQLEVLIEPEAGGYRWQRSHRVTDKIDRLSERLASVLSRSGTLSWEDEMGSELVAELAARDATADSWVSSSDVVTMVTVGSRSALDEVSEDPLDQLLAAQRLARDSERRAATLQWLLED